jgi:hypothetical protein
MQGLMTAAQPHREELYVMGTQAIEQTRFHGTEETMTQWDPHIEEVIAQLRQMLPADLATAQAIDRHEPWEQIATKAIADGYIERADEFVRFVEACVRRQV